MVDDAALQADVSGALSTLLEAGWGMVQWLPGSLRMAQAFTRRSGWFDWFTHSDGPNCVYII